MSEPSATQARPAGKRTRSPRIRAAVTNGNATFLGGGDRRTEVGRRFADIIADLEAERGGREVIATAEREAIRTYAGLVLKRDLMHAALGRGEDVDAEMLGQIGDRMDRQVRRMGPPSAPARKSLRDHVATNRSDRT